MFNTPVLDLVILLSFTYFIGSLILSAINEAIAGTFRLRQKDLKKGMCLLFSTTSWRYFITHTFFKSPHIQALMKTSTRVPAYIPARSFVSVIVENLDEAFYKANQIVSRKKGTEGHQTDVLPGDMQLVLKTIMQQVSSLPPEQIKLAFEKRLEAFYNDAMDRVTGWYKRRVRRILLALGLVLSVVLNMDTIKIVNDAMLDKAKLAKAVDNISANILKYDSIQQKSVVVKDSAGNISIRETAGGAEQLLLTYEHDTGYELGYSSFENFTKQWRVHFFTKLLGVLLTAFALQLGSNYWFDLMNKAVNVRAAGRRPQEDRTTPKNEKS